MIKIWRKGIVFFLYMQAIPNVSVILLRTISLFYSECFVILLQIAIENNTYLGTWRNFAWELGVNTRGCVSILTHPPFLCS